MSGESRLCHRRVNRLPIKLAPALALALVVPLTTTATAGAAAPARSPAPTGAATEASSVVAAYTFLDRTMDLQASGTTRRLVQSFVGGPLARQHFTDSETYDDALTLDAFLVEGSADGVARASTIGNGLLYVQANDPKGDGRIRAAYAPGALTSPQSVVIRDATSDVGNMAWVGKALTRLAAATGNSNALAGAERIGAWIETNCRDTRGAGGFTGGLTASGAAIRWKSTEHNIDLEAFYSMLSAETGAAEWSSDADWARGFVTTMWDGPGGHFYVGTLDDGVTPNLAEQPEDVNSWSYLTLEDPTYAASIDWDVQNLAVTTRQGFAGVSFCEGARKGVWFEGTAHLADALEARGRPGDAALAQQYLSDIQTAQARGPNTDGSGIIAASKRLSDCDGDYYFPSLHIGATSWYVLAALGVDPMRPAT